MELRDYQAATVDALFDYVSTQTGGGIAVLPTGAGKSVVIAEFARRAAADFPELRVLVLAHSKELLVQNAQKLADVWKGCPIGVYSAGLRSKQIRSQVLVAGVQSIYDKAYQLQTPRAPDLVIIDECHLLSPKSNTMYRRLLSDLRTINPRLALIGLSATPWRLDSGPLTGGDDPIFTGIAYNVGILELVEKGWLCPLVSKATVTKLDTSGVALRGGDFVVGELQRAVDIDSTTQAAVDEIIQFGRDRTAWLAFCAGVDHAYHVRDAIRSRGYTCETVTGDTPAVERADILAKFKSGAIRAVTNANVLTTGVDIPSIDLLAFLRPTKSSALYLQMAGRAMRLSPETGKRDALCLDFARVIQTHGPVDQVRMKDRKKGEGPAPVKECPACEEHVFASARVCPCCGHEFPPPEELARFESTASFLNVMSNEAPAPKVAPEWIEVTSVSYRVWPAKPGKPPTLRVDYRCGLISHPVWVALEHDGYARQKGVAWWRQASGQKHTPATISMAMEQLSLLRQPSHIQVRPNGKFVDVLAYRFESAEAEAA